jgi:hypothetical protein
MLTRGTDARSPCEICASIRRPLTGEMHHIVHSKHLSVMVCQHQARLHQTRPCIWSHGEILNVLCEGEAINKLPCTMLKVHHSSHRGLCTFLHTATEPSQYALLPSCLFWYLFSNTVCALCFTEVCYESRTTQLLDLTSQTLRVSAS